VSEQLEPELGYPKTYHCAECGAIFWDGNRRGHYFNGDEIICPNEEEDEHGY